MPKREPAQNTKAFPSLPAEAALSFLKDTKGALTWSARDLAETLKIDRREAEQALAFLEAQGYVQPANKKKSTEWMTTPAGETVSGAKSPRFTRESVEQALTALKDRIKQNKKDPQARFRVSDAVAFGDFLLPDRARVQAADVGIRLIRPESTANRKSRKQNAANGSSIPAPPRSASDAQAERNFLRDLRAKSAHLNLRPYADWMRTRSHRSLLSQ
jgi:DNA-binding transcriptional MocR family regulator